MTSLKVFKILVILTFEDFVNNTLLPMLEFLTYLSTLCFNLLVYGAIKDHKNLIINQSTEEFLASNFVYDCALK